MFDTYTYIVYKYKVTTTEIVDFKLGVCFSSWSNCLQLQIYCLHYTPLVSRNLLVPNFDSPSSLPPVGVRVVVACLENILEIQFKIMYYYISNFIYFIQPGCSSGQPLFNILLVMSDFKCSSGRVQPVQYFYLK